MRLEWDPKKAKADFEKHGVRFAEAYDVLADPLAVTVDDDHEDESRFITIGSNATGGGRVVVHTWRGERYRIISVRKATPPERRQYEEET